MAYAFANANSQCVSATSAPVSQSPYTFSASMNRPTSNLAGIVALANRSDGRDYATIYTLNDANSNYARMQVSSVATAAKIAVTSQAITNSQWTNIVGFQSSATNRKIYLDAGGSGLNEDSSDPNTLNGILLGAATTGLASYIIGNYYNGLLAEAAIWNVALTDAEIASLAKGFKPTRIRPQSLVFYAPLLRNLQDLKGGLALTNNNGATVADHPRVY